MNISSITFIYIKKNININFIIYKIIININNK